jgi:hypothetical protein
MTPKTTVATHTQGSHTRKDPLAEALADLISLLAGNRASHAATATADGLTTGIVPDTAAHVQVTSGNADHIIALPTPSADMIGRTIVLQNAGTGYELRSNDPATVGINGGTGAGAESAIAANVTVHATLASLTNWTAFQQTSAGVLTLTQVAA